MGRRVSILALIALAAALLSWIAVVMLGDEPVVTADPPAVVLPPPAAIPATAAEEYRPSPAQTDELKPSLLWVMDLQSGEELQIRFAAPSAPGAIVYVDIAAGSRAGVQKVADFCNRARGEWATDIVGAARRVGLAITDAVAARAFCTATTSSIAAAGPAPGKPCAPAPGGQIPAGKRP